MSEAIIAKKAELVDAVAEQMKAATSIVVVDARGLTVEQDTVLRRNLRGEEVEYKVIKNSILRRAAVQAGLDGLTELFVGPSAVAFSTDAVAPAKVCRTCFLQIGILLTINLLTNPNITLPHIYRRQITLR